MFDRNPKPLDILLADIQAIENGKSPLHDQNDLLRSLKLDGPKRDGLTLADRLLPHGVLSQIVEGKKAIRVRDGVQSSIHRIVDNKIMPGDEEFARNLSAVATAQITREGNICPGAMALAYELASVRPDYFSDEIKSSVSRGMTSLLQEEMHLRALEDLLIQLGKQGEQVEPAYVIRIDKNGEQITRG